MPVQEQKPIAGLNEPFAFFHTYSDTDEVEEWQVTLESWFDRHSGTRRGRATARQQVP